MLIAASLVALAGCVLFAVERRRRLACAELVARAAHELRGPLAAAHLGLQTLGRQPGVQRWRCASVDIQLQRAALAVADLAAAPRRGRAGDRPGLVEVGRLLEEQVRAWHPMAASYGCELVLAPVPPSAVVQGDRLRLGQAIGNVLANAAEHGRGRIELSAHESGDRVRIEVVDDGPGLPAPVADLVARPRAGRGARGRGLAIAADVVRRHGGRLASAPSDRGARLAIDLPAAESGGARRFTRDPGASPGVPAARRAAFLAKARDVAATSGTRPR
jgi:signal transduction histidine kinase